jgi:hypothetical protein
MITRKASFSRTHVNHGKSYGNVLLVLVQENWRKVFCIQEGRSMQYLGVLGIIVVVKDNGRKINVVYNKSYQ